MPKMRHQSARRSRPMSPKELRELYGVPVMQIKTSEDTFRRESYKRDKQRLRKVVDAIDAEKRQVERLWDVTRSRFVQEHQDLVHPPNRKQPVYRKVASFQGLSVNAVPPCIPFLGTFPPNRHPSTVRRVTDMDKEPLFSRGVLPEFDSATDDSFQYYGAAERTPDNILQHEYLNPDGLPDDFNFFLANRRILHTTGMGVNGTATTTAPSSRALSGKRPGQINMNNSSSNNQRAKPFAENQRMNGHSLPNGHTSAQNKGQSVQTKQTKPDLSATTAVSNGGTGPSSPRKQSEPENGQAEEQASIESGGQDGTTSSRTSDGTGSVGSLDVEKLQRALVEHAHKNLVTHRHHQRHLSNDPHRFINTEYGDHLPMSPRELMDSGLLTPVSYESLMTPTTRSASDISEMQYDTQMVVIQIIMKLFKELDASELENLEYVWPEKMRTLMSDIEALVRHTSVDITDIVEKIQQGDLQDDKSAALLDWIKNIDDATPSAEAISEADVADSLLRLGSSVTHRRSIDRHSAVERRDSEQFSDRRNSLQRRKSIDAGVLAGNRRDSATSQLLFGPFSSSSNQDKRVTPAINVEPPSRRQSRNIEIEEVRPVRRTSAVHTPGLLSAGSTKSRTRSLSAGRDPQINKQRRPSQVGLDMMMGKQPQSNSQQEVHYAPETSNDAALFFQRRKNSLLLNKSLSIQQTEENTEGESANVAVSRQNSAPAYSTGDSERQAKTKGQNSVPKLPDVKVTVAQISPRSESNNDESNLRLPSFSPRRSVMFASTETLPVSSVDAEDGQDFSDGRPPRSKGAAGRRVSFSQTYKIDSHTSPSSGHVPSYANRSSETNRRNSRANSFSQSLSSGSSDERSKDGEFRRRVSSTGQMYQGRKLSNDTQKNQTSSKRRSISPSSPRQQKTSQADERVRRSSQNNMLAVPDQDDELERLLLLQEEDREQTTATLTHVDRRGQAHRLNMRKVSISAGREANVVFTREDTPTEVHREDDAKNLKHRGSFFGSADDAIKLKESLLGNILALEDSQKSENKHGEVNDNRQELKTGEVNELQAAAQANNASEKSQDVQGETSAQVKVSETEVDNEEKMPELATTVNNDEINRKQSTEGAELNGLADNENQGNDDDESEVDEREKQQVWRHRLKRGGRKMSWVPELTTDHKAQGVALAMLYEKQGIGAKFRSTVLSVICVNALMAAKNVYDDSSWKEMRKCRYLRMPKDYYMSDLQRELTIKEIFSK